MATGWDAWESYFYPETYDPETLQGTLRNKLGLRGADALRRAEYAATRMRAGEIQRGNADIDRTYGLEHLQGIHRHLFQDVYEWAGELRIARMAKDEDTEFAQLRDGSIARTLDDVQEFVESVHWSKLNRPKFIAGTAAVYAYLNQAHPFREGNGRTARVYLQHVAEQSQYRIDFSKISKAEWDTASAESMPRGDRSWSDPRPIMHALRDAATPTRTTARTVRRRVADPDTGPATGHSPTQGPRGPEL